MFPLPSEYFPISLTSYKCINNNNNQSLIMRLTMQFIVQRAGEICDEKHPCGRCVAQNIAHMCFNSALYNNKRTAKPGMLCLCVGIMLFCLYYVLCSVVCVNVLVCCVFFGVLCSFVVSCCVCYVICVKLYHQ
jgi:hypothetical protein